MKYLVRAVKYFFYLFLILFIIILVLMAAKLVESDPSKLFIHGYDSIWQIAIIMAVFAAIYPRIGFSTRNVHLLGSPEEVHGTIVKVLDQRGYKLEKDNDGTMTFVERSPISRALKMWEDRMTFSTTAGGIEVEGLTRDLVRLVSALESTCEGE